MAAIEGTGMLPGGAAGLALQDLSTTAMPVRAEGMTPQAVADMSDLKKQELAKDFESVLLTRLFNEVKASISASSFDEDAGSDQIHGMFWSFLAEDVADKGGFGLWKDLYQHFKDMEGTGTPGALIDKEL
jgi:hypothetical protein